MVMTRNSGKHGRHDSRQLICACMRKAWEEGWMEVEREREFWESEREGDWKRGKGECWIWVFASIEPLTLNYRDPSDHEEKRT